jgi:hypothetical protein
MIFGYFFVFFGLILLLKNLGVLTADFWGIIFPLLIISGGFLILFKKRPERNETNNQE